MKSSRQLAVLVAVGVSVLVAAPARASFHLMQIEQVVGGVCGDTSQQAIQLRMRSAGQNVLSLGPTLVAYDAAGLNPVTLYAFGANVPNDGVGVRVLISSAQFPAGNGPSPDFTLTNTIPQSYLAAGRLVFQFGPTIYWSLAWGGAAYTGSNAGSTDNDDNTPGNFGPPFGSALPSSGARALRFTGAAGAESTSNLADFALTSGGAVFTNNAGTSGAALNCAIFTDGFESGDTSAWSFEEPEGP